MNRKHLPLAAVLAAVFFAGASNAQQAMSVSPQTPWSAEVGYSWMNIRDSGIGFRVHPQALRGIVGYSFHPNVAVEGMAAFGTRSADAFGVDVKMRNAYGIFVKPKFAFNNLEVFGRAGWARTSLRASALGASAGGSENDFAWGAGAAYNFSPRMYASLDYMRLHNKNDTRVDGWTAGLGWRF